MEVGSQWKPPIRRGRLPMVTDPLSPSFVLENPATSKYCIIYRELQSRVVVPASFGERNKSIGTEVKGSPSLRCGSKGRALRSRVAVGSLEERCNRGGYIFRGNWFAVFLTSFLIG